MFFLISLKRLQLHSLQAEVLRFLGDIQDAILKPYGQRLVCYMYQS